MIVYTREDFQKRVVEITSGNKVPVVYDSVGKDTFMKSLDCLAPLGLLAFFGQSSGPVEPFNLALLAQKGSLFITRPTLQTYGAKREAMVAMAKELFDVVQSGVVKININQTYPLIGRVQGASRPRSAQDHRFDGAHDLGDCRYGAAPR